VGEGIVFYPQITSNLRKDITYLMFKAKGEQHRVRKASKPIEVDPAVVSTIEDFVTTFATAPRFAQGLNEVCGPTGPTMRDLGSFLGWVGRDIQKEGDFELERGGLTWKQVAKSVTLSAKAWFMTELGKR
jgi:hypothetical protein